MNHVPTLALAFALAAPMMAHAAPQSETVAVATAAYGDLDLNRASDAKIMVRRLDRAALEACGASRASFRDYRTAVQRGDCYKDGMRQALADLNAPAVTQAYLGASSIVSASN